MDAKTVCAADLFVRCYCDFVGSPPLPVSVLSFAYLLKMNRGGDPVNRKFAKLVSQCEIAYRSSWDEKDFWDNLVLRLALIIEWRIQKGPWLDSDPWPDERIGEVWYWLDEFMKKGLIPCGDFRLLVEQASFWRNKSAESEKRSRRHS